ncbi:MAG TPA: hypothetical protein VNX15_01095 [Gemmatimonadales bacterium]|jgi:hypothetical protein|nr:hypothetical protein [Gemmatimonadales bacterium]
MTGWRKTAYYGVVTLMAMWCFVAARPLGAQQSSDSVVLTRPSAPPATAAAASLPGPRLSPEWRRTEPRMGDRSAAMPASGDSHTLRISTLVLVLVVVILVLLIVR